MYRNCRVFLGLVFFLVLNGEKSSGHSVENYHDFGDVRIEGSAVVADKAASGFMAYSSLPWKDGVVPIKFHGRISKANLNRFWRACQVWGDVANVSCRVKRSSDKNYLFITNTDSNRCWTELGAGINGGERKFNFANDWCWKETPLIHEIGHVLGLMHEHQRPDRDLYIDVFPENAGEYAYAYDKLTLGDMDNQGPYDFLSIMHYWNAAYSINKKPILVPKKGYEDFEKVMGRATTLSLGDKILIQRIYGAP